MTAYKRAHKTKANGPTPKSRKRILICNDQQSQSGAWERAIAAVGPTIRDYSVEVLNADDFRTAFDNLEARRRNARLSKAKHDAATWDVVNPFDNTAIVVVDYDLLQFDADSYITGEIVAYLARCYSNCGFIIALNRFGKNPFDLTLRGHPESFADLHIGGKQLGAGGLWKSPWDGFRPWVWPLLPDAVTALEKRVQDVAQNLRTPILEFLAFPPEVVQALPRSAVEFLGSGEHPQRTTFLDFISKSGNGLRPRDQTSEGLAPRVAAARLHKWLERMVLAGQDLLVDAPHLVSRFPSLLNVKRPESASAKTWSVAARLAEGAPAGMNTDAIDTFRLAKNHWLSRPAWFWRPLSREAKIAEVLDPWSVRIAPFVFCEDVSAFVPREAAREFVADVDSPFAVRFVVDTTTSAGREYANALRDIDYQPGVRFAL